MKHLGILFSVIFLFLSSASTYALTSKQSEAFELFGISRDQVERLENNPRLNLSFDEDAKLFSRLLTALQIGQLAKLDIAMNDEAHMPSYLELGRTMAQTGEASAAVRLVGSAISRGLCHIDIFEVGPREILDNFGLDPSVGLGFVDFHQVNQTLFNIRELATAKHDTELERRLTEIIYTAADRYTSSGRAIAFSTCGNNSVSLDDDRCCADGADGVAQICNDKDDSKCGIFHRNGTTVCRIGSDDC